MKKPISLLLIGCGLFLLCSCKFSISPDQYTGTWTGSYRLSNWIPSEGDATVVLTEAGDMKVNILFTCIHDTIYVPNCTMRRYSGGLYGSLYHIENIGGGTEDASCYLDVEQGEMYYYYDSSFASFNFSGQRQ